MGTHTIGLYKILKSRNEQFTWSEHSGMYRMMYLLADYVQGIRGKSHIGVSIFYAGENKEIMALMTLPEYNVHS